MQPLKSCLTYVIPIALFAGCDAREVPAAPPAPDYVLCNGKFEELGPYKGVRIACDDGRKFLYWPNKYLYSRKAEDAASKR
jgi:hypothetical protein